MLFLPGLVWSVGNYIPPPNHRHPFRLLPQPMRPFATSFLSLDRSLVSFVQFFFSFYYHTIFSQSLNEMEKEKKMMMKKIHEDEIQTVGICVFPPTSSSSPLLSSFYFSLAPKTHSLSLLFAKKRTTLFTRSTMLIEFS